VVKKRNFVKNRIVVKNEKFGQKSKLWSKMKNFVKNRNVVKNRNFGQISKLVPKKEFFGQKKPKFSPKKEISVKNPRNIFP